MRPLYLCEIMLFMDSGAYGVCYIHPQLGRDEWWRDKVGEGMRGELYMRENKLNEMSGPLMATLLAWVTGTVSDSAAVEAIRSAERLLRGYEPKDGD